MRILADLRIPIAFGLKSGHVSSERSRCPSACSAKLSAGADEGVALSCEAAVQGSWRWYATGSE